MNIWVVISLTLPALAYGQQCQVRGECIGFSLDQAILGSERHCWDQCQRNGDCQWYSYDHKNGFCNALLNCMSVDTSCSTCISGENECSLPLQCFVQGSCSGVFLDHVNMPTSEDCLKTCQQNYPNCNWFSYFPLTRVCSLFATCNLNTTQTDAISGEKGCNRELQCFVQGDCTGLYIDHVSTSSKEACLKTCYEDYPRCNWFSYYDSGLCTLYETCTVDSTETGVVSGEKSCYDTLPKGATKLIVQMHTTVRMTHTPSHVENGTSCSVPPAYPYTVYYTEGQVIEGALTICGGWSGVDECMRLDRSTNTWVEFAQLDVARGAAASVISPQGWWITGGGELPAVMTTSSILNGTKWARGPDLPIARRVHCMAQVNATHSFMAGGWDGVSSASMSDAYLYDWPRQVWIRLDNMPKGQRSFACHLHRDQSGRERILTAGGIKLDNKQIDEELTVHSFDLSTLEWSVLPNLPTRVYNGFFVQDGNDLVVISGAYGYAAKFNPETDSFTYIYDFRLPLYDGSSNVIPVTDDSLAGCV